MCVGCLVGACTLLLTWGSGQLIAWRATAKRNAAMARVLAQDAAGQPGDQRFEPLERDRSSPRAGIVVGA